MLTFSLAGKWMMEEPAGAKKHLITSDIAEAGKPFFSNPSGSKGLLSGNITPPGSTFQNLPETSSDSRGLEILPEVWDLAGTEDFTRTEGIPETLEEILTPTSQETEAEDLVDTAGLVPPAGTQPELQEVHHALRPVEAFTPTAKKSKKSQLRDSGKLDSHWAGNPYGRRRGARTGGPAGHGQDVLVRTTVEPSAKGRLLVRFVLSNSGGAFGNLNDLLSADSQLDAQLAHRAAELLRTMDEAVEESSEETDTEVDRDREERERLQKMQRKLVQHLRQRPGGLELVAELTPDQLDILMHKLSARNMKLRALIEG